MTAEALRDLITHSANVGSDIDLVQASGGNTSWKSSDTAWVKGSGKRLKDAEAQNIFSQINFQALTQDLIIECEDFAPFSNGVISPSIETNFHLIIDNPFVTHLHSLSSIALGVLDINNESLRSFYQPRNISTIPYARPGKDLAIKISGTPLFGEHILLLENHGVIFHGASTSILEKDIRIFESDVRKFLTSLPINKNAPDWIEILTSGVLTPDEAVFLGKRPFFKSDSQIPNVITISSNGEISFPDGASQDRIDLALFYVRVAKLIEKKAEIRYLPQAEVDSLLNWDREKIENCDVKLVQLIIPMSGIGQRFIDKGYKVPKPLIQISGKPMVQHVVEMYPGIEEVLFIVNKNHFEDAKLELQVKLNEIAPGCAIAVIDSHKFGPAWAIAMARQYVNLEAPVVVNYCDFACLWDFEAFRASLASGVDGVIATYSGFHPHMLRNTQYAYLRLDENGFVTDIQEKLSFTASPMGEPASSGTYGFKSGQVLLDAIDSQINQGHSYNNEFYSSLTYKSMLQNDLKIRSFEIRKFFQWGTPEDFEEFKKQKDFFVFKQGIQRQPKKPDRIEILAAGAGQRFVDVGYLQPKPFLPLGNTFLAFEALNAISPNSKRNGLLLQSAFEVTGQFEEILLNSETRVITVEKLTSGQAASALLVLEQNDKGNCIIATCDSLLFPKPEENFDMFREKTLGVWVTNPSAFALSHPKQFGWVKSGQDCIVTDTWVKEAPDEIDSAQVITGTFIFGDSREAQILLRKFLDSPSKVNGEFYLDSVLQFAAESEWKVVALDPEWFVSLGTPSEYETYLYWESLFNERLDLLKSDDN